MGVLGRVVMVGCEVAVAGCVWVGGTVLVGVAGWLEGLLLGRSWSRVSSASSPFSEACIAARIEGRALGSPCARLPNTRLCSANSTFRVEASLRVSLMSFPAAISREARVRLTWSCRYTTDMSISSWRPSKIKRRVSIMRLLENSRLSSALCVSSPDKAREAFSKASLSG